MMMCGKYDIVAITGGIGAGKSVVSTILRHMGHDVYDCDSEAKSIMDNSDTIKQRIAIEISPETIINNHIDRRKLAHIVFNSQEKLTALNRIVHTAVIDDILVRASKKTRFPFFIETAILYQSGLDKIVREVWDVSVPEEIRITRVMERNNITRQEVVNRINSQKIIPTTPHPNVKVIVNDNVHPILPQILKLLQAHE